MLSREFSSWLSLSLLLNFNILFLLLYPLHTSLICGRHSSVLLVLFFFFCLLLVATCGHVPVEGGEMLWRSYSESY